MCKITLMPIMASYENFFLNLKINRIGNLVHICVFKNRFHLIFEWWIGVEGWDPVNQFNFTSWVAVVTPTDRPKSVRNRRLIEHFGGF